jgi:23S rRNA (guanosine2251-2'-O)-methyltransferase
MYWSKWYHCTKSGFSTSKRRYRKTSAGAVFNIPICKVEHIKDAIFLLQASGIKTIAATERQIPIYDISLNEPVAIIMGSEDRGVNPSVLKIDEKLNFLCLEVLVP